MTPTRYRILLIACATVLVALVAAAVWWPDGEERADLEVVASVPTTTSTTTTTAPSTTAAPTTTVPTGPVDPTRIRIDAIGLDAPVVPVALQADGQMEVPPAAEVGWYRLGPQPGAGGSAVLAAHVDFGGERGAFFDLRSVPVGAELVIDGAGGPRRFLVTGREQIAKADIRLEEYFTAEGPARLALITCGGAFDRGIGHYQDNIVVTAVPVT